MKRYYGISELETINTNILIHKKECVSDPTLLTNFFRCFLYANSDLPVSSQMSEVSDRVYRNLSSFKGQKTRHFSSGVYIVEQLLILFPPPCL